MKMNKMIHYRRFLLLLALLSGTTFGMAQTSFDADEGCLNVVNVSSAQGLGQYGDGGVSANYMHELFLNERFSIGAGIGYITVWASTSACVFRLKDGRDY